jgi:hypothetical protein
LLWEQLCCFSLNMQYIFALKEISLKRKRAVANRCERQWNELDNNYVLYVLVKRISEAVLLLTVHDTLLPHLHLITSLYQKLYCCSQYMIHFYHISIWLPLYIRSYTVAHSTWYTSTTSPSDYLSISEAILLLTVHDTLLTTSPSDYLSISLFALEVWLFCQQATIVLLGFKEFNWLLKSQLQIFIILKRVLH